MIKKITDLIVGTKRHTEHQLNLSNLNLSARDVSSIIEYLNEHPEITDLNLSHNELGDDGIMYFAKHNTSVITLNLAKNLICARGVIGFAQHNTVVTSLNLTSNLISEWAINFAKHNTQIITK